MFLYVVLGVALGLIALIFFSAERSLSVFSWFRLQELNAPRSRKNAAGNCLRNRGLVVTTFLVAGCLTVAALSVVLVVGVRSRWFVGLELLFLVPFLGWILPEVIAWRMGDWLAIYLVPALYEIVGIPFRALRLGLLRQTTGPGDESAQTESDSSSQANGADTRAHRMFRSAVRMKYIQVRDIMTPRTDMVTVADTATLREAAQVSTESGYSRLPVYRSNRDQIVGILHAKDLLKFAATEKWDQPALPELLRQPSFVPETKTVSELMEELQRSNVHLGIVVDEYGGTLGLVTLEDIVEELIGEIRDEHEMPHETPPLFKWEGNRTVELAASMRIETFNNEFDLDLPEEEGFDTVGGLATFMMAKIPQSGESFQVSGARITVIQADPRRVVRVRVDFDREPPAPGKGVTVPYHRTCGVVLRCTEYSESSQVAAILTPDLGQIHALAKGARRPRKDGRGALDLLDYCDLVLAQRPAGQLHILADWTLRERFPRLRADLGRIWLACYAVEIALAATTESVEDGAVCHDLVDLLRALDRGENEHLALFRFLFRALRTLGHIPATENCTQCGGPLHGHTRFSPASGGALCGDCAVRDPSAFSISRGSLAVMTRLAAEGPGAPLRVTRDQVREIRRAFNDQIQYHLGKPLRSERFLAEV